jgi:hypothetical protein
MADVSSAWAFMLMKFGMAVNMRMIMIDIAIGLTALDDILPGSFRCEQQDVDIEVSCLFSTSPQTPGSSSSCTIQSINASRGRWFG